MWRKNTIMPFYLVFQFLIFQLFLRESCFSQDSYPRIPHPRFSSVPAELPSKLVMSGKQNIWSCNHNCVRKRLVFASIVNFCWKLLWCILIGTYFASCEKVPTGTFSSWDQVACFCMFICMYVLLVTYTCCNCRSAKSTHMSLFMFLCSVLALLQSTTCTWL